MNGRSLEFYLCGILLAVMKRSTIKLSNINLEYVTAGNGPDFLFLHGGSVSYRSYVNFIDTLAEHFTVWAPSVPGAGRSSRLSQSWQFSRYKEVVDSFITQFKIRPIIAGHSFGGAIAAVAKASFPDRFNELVLFSPAGIPHDKPSQAVQTVIMNKIKSLFFLKNWDANKDIFINLFFQLSSMRTISQLFTDLDITHKLQAVTDRTLLFWGSDDEILPIDQVKKVKEKIPQVQEYTITGPHSFLNMQAQKVSSILQKELLTA